MARLFGQPLGQCLRHTAVHQHTPGRHADLTLVHVRTERDSRGSLVQIRVVQHDHRIVATQFQRDFLQMASGNFADAAAGGRGAGERNHRDIRRLHQCLANLRIAVQHVQQSLRQTGFFQHLRDDHATGVGSTRVRLEDHRIAHRQRRRHRA